MVKDYQYGHSSFLRFHLLWSVGTWVQIKLTLLRPSWEWLCLILQNQFQPGKICCVDTLLIIRNKLICWENFLKRDFYFINWKSLFEILRELFIMFIWKQDQFILLEIILYQPNLTTTCVIRVKGKKKTVYDSWRQF